MKFNDEFILDNLKNPDYRNAVFGFLDDSIFDGERKKVFNIIKIYFNAYKKWPSLKELNVEISKYIKSENDAENYSAILTKMYNAEPIDNLQWIMNKTEQYILTKKVYNAVSTSVVEFEREDPNFNSLLEQLKNAVSFKFDRNLGMAYILDFQKRMEMYSEQVEKTPFDLEFFDKYSRKGDHSGFEKATLNICLAPTNGGKSIWLVDRAAKALMRGMNVLYVSLEMSEQAILERIDANMHDIDINDIPLRIDDLTKKMQALKKKITGEIYVKRYPPRSINSNAIRNLLSEFQKSGINIDLLIVDYIGILAPNEKIQGANTNTMIQRASEDLRGLAIEFLIPVWSAQQFNRNAYDSSDPSLADISEGISLAQTSDFIFAIINIAELETINQCLCKILKNRYGPLNVTSNIGLNKSKMRFYDVQNDARYGLSATPNKEPEPLPTSNFKF